MAFSIIICIFVLVLPIFVNGLKQIDSSSAVDVSTFLEGDGNPWLLTQDGLETAISTMNKTRKTLYFPAGTYYSETRITLDISNVFPDSDDRHKTFSSGVKIIGEHYGSVIQIGKLRNQTEPAFWVKWTGHGVFFWEFSEIAFVGDTDHTLLKFGNEGGNGYNRTGAWNSCIFKLSVNNHYKDNDIDDSTRGPAIGLFMVQPLQSDIRIISTCAKGVAVRLRSCEFSTISGSFSNTESDVMSTEGLTQITSNRYLIFCILQKV